MNVHKFNVKPKYGSDKTIKWLIPRDVKHSAEKKIRVHGKFFVKKILYYNLTKLNN